MLVFFLKNILFKRNLKGDEMNYLFFVIFFFIIIVVVMIKVMINVSFIYFFK